MSWPLGGIPARYRGRTDLLVNRSFWVGAAIGGGAAWRRPLEQLARPLSSADGSQVIESDERPSTYRYWTVIGMHFPGPLGIGHRWPVILVETRSVA